MNVRRLVALGVAALTICASTQAWATIVIRTNDGGADAEVRENFDNRNEVQVPIDPNDPFAGTVAHYLGLNRGSSTEIATRVNDTTSTATGGGESSSLFYLKFDISNLPDQNDSFWTDKKVTLRLHVRNNNLSSGRIYDVKPGGNPLHFDQYVRMQFNVRGLEPNPYKNGVDTSGGYRYGDDDASAYNRTDQAGNAYTANFYEYDWKEGTGVGAGGENGQQPTGITWTNAPGLTPACRIAVNCTQGPSIGIIEDNINSDMKLLGTWQWPRTFPRNHLPVGLALDFTDDDIKQLILDAKTHGRDSVTLIVSHGLDPLNPANGGTQTPAGFLGFNYLAIPKEMLTLNDDANYDPDGGDPSINQTLDNYHSVNNPTGDQEVGSPFSCSFNLTTRPQCTGLGNNSAGAFSPKLIIQVPEPASAALVALGLLAAWGIVRRRK